MPYSETVEHAIDELVSLDYSAEDIYQRVTQIIRSIDQFPIIKYKVHTNDIFFRSRPNLTEDYFDQISTISFPPSENVSEFKRANIPGQSVFYCSDRRPTSYLELIEYIAAEFQIGDDISVTISMWQAVIDFDVILMVNPNGRFEAEYNQRHRDGFDGLLNSMEEEHRAGTTRLYEYFGEKFSSYASNRPDIYILTSALSNILVNDSSVEGIMYPSVAFQERGFNLALKPQAIEDVKLRLIGVAKDNFHIASTADGKHNFIQSTPTENAIINYSSGSLAWTRETQ